MVTIIQERPNGERIMQDAHRVFPGWARDRSPNGWAVPSTSSGSPREPRSVTGATLTYYGAHGIRDGRGRGGDAAGLPPAARKRATGSSPIGSTACTRAIWWCRASRCHRPTRRTSNWGLTEYAARFTYDGQVGYGMFECAVMGPHQQYGFTGWE